MRKVSEPMREESMWEAWLAGEPNESIAGRILVEAIIDAVAAVWAGVMG